MMKRMLPIAILVLVGTPAYAGWEQVETKNQLAGMRSMYIDPSTIQKEGNLVTVVELIDFKDMQGGTSPGRYSSQKIRVQFDCAKEQLRFLSITDYADNMGGGDKVGGASGGDWEPVKSTSIHRNVWEAVCKK